MFARFEFRSRYGGFSRSMFCNNDVWKGVQHDRVGFLQSTSEDLLLPLSRRGGEEVLGNIRVSLAVLFPRIGEKLLLVNDVKRSGAS